MRITLKFAGWKTNNGYQSDPNRFKDFNEVQLAGFFDGNDVKPEVHIINEVTELDFYYDEFKDFNLAIQCFLQDLKDDKSALFNKYKPKNKITFTLDFLDVFFREVWSDRYSDISFDEFDAFYGHLRNTFITYISGDVTQGRPYLDIYDLNPDEFLRGVAVWYYKELGAWDREFLRNNAEEMEYLKYNWIDSLSFGPH